MNSNHSKLETQNRFENWFWRTKAQARPNH